MSRRPAKRRPAKRAAAPVTRMAFEPEHRDLFRLADADWTPPADIVVRHGVRSWTLKADFTMTNGHSVTLTTKLVRTKTGGVIVADESMTVAWKLRGRK